jgi:biotin operon repressor
MLQLMQCIQQSRHNVNRHRQFLKGGIACGKHFTTVVERRSNRFLEDFMTGKTSGKVVAVVNDDNFREFARLAGYQMANSFVAQHMILSAALNMKPVKMLVFMTIATATVQKFMRQREIPDELGGTQRLSRDFIGYISRRAIASATGLPRETVRRAIIDLENDGLLITGPNGSVANKGQILDRPEIVEGLRLLTHEISSSTEKLMNLNIVEIKNAKV